MHSRETFKLFDDPIQLLFVAAPIPVAQSVAFLPSDDTYLERLILLSTAIDGLNTIPKYRSCTDVAACLKHVYLLKQSRREVDLSFWRFLDTLVVLIGILAGSQLATAFSLSKSLRSHQATAQYKREG